MDLDGSREPIHDKADAAAVRSRFSAVSTVTRRPNVVIADMWSFQDRF